jgi:hypothetical protein
LAFIKGRCASQRESRHNAVFQPLLTLVNLKERLLQPEVEMVDTRTLYAGNSPPSRKLANLLSLQETFHSMCVIARHPVRNTGAH